MSKNTNKKMKICLVSSSGGHYEQLKMMKSLGDMYDLFFVTEKTDYNIEANYYVLQTGSNDKFFIIKMMMNSLIALKIFIKERPDIVITTGTMIVLPFMLLAKLSKKKFIFVETFARVYDGTRAGKFMYKYADLFLYQWEPLIEVYPNGVFGGGLY